MDTKTILMQWYLRGYKQTELKYYQACKVFDNYCRAKTFPFYSLSFRERNPTYKNWFSYDYEGSNFSEIGEEEIAVFYNDGSVFVEHVEFYDEFWVGFFKHEDIDDSDPTYGSEINSLCWCDWYTSVNAWMLDRQPFCIIPELKWRALTPVGLGKYIPYSCFNLCEFELLEDRFDDKWKERVPNLVTIDGYKFWFRAFYCNVVSSYNRYDYIFDVFYPRKAHNNQRIKIKAICKSGETIDFDWNHGKHGLTRMIINFFNSKL